MKMVFEDESAFDPNQAYGEPVFHIRQRLRHVSYDWMWNYFFLVSQYS